jgi:hypothetical protein
MIEDPYSLVFSYPSSTTTTSDIAPLTSIPFTLTGATRIVWEFDAAKLQNDLVGLAETAFPSVLSGYPAIERAEAVVRPFWKKAFPETAEEIEVIVRAGGDGG